MVLSFLDPIDEVESLGAVADDQGEHFQASLAASEGVAALVRQTGHHLADRGQPFGLHGALLGLLEERDVLADLEDRGAIFVIGQVACVPQHRAARAVATRDRILEPAGRVASDDPRELVGHGLTMVFG